MIKLDAIITIAEQGSASIDSATNMEIGGSTGAEINGDLSGVINETNAETPYIGEQTCDENGVFERSNLITINGKDMLSVNVVFDKKNNQHPKTIVSSNFVENRTITVEVGGERVSNGIRFYTYIPVDEPLISVTNVKRYDLDTTDLNPIKVVSSTIKASANNQILLYEILTGTMRVKYEIEIEVLSSENLKKTSVNSPVVDVGIGKPTDRIMFLVNDWNTPNSKMVISGISLPSNVEYYVGGANLQSVSSNVLDRKDEVLPSYGVISNGGNLDFIDYNREIEKYIANNIDTQNMKVEITLHNTLTRRKQLVGILYTNEWEYDDDSKNVSVSLLDDLIEWQNIKFLGMPLKNEMTLLEIYEYLRGITPSKFEFEEMDEETTSYMQSVKCTNPYIEEGSLWSAYDKLCQIGALHIYKNKNKVIVKHLI